MLDLYCERTGPGLWAEPLNALSNLAYVAAAWAAWRSARGAADPGARLLVGLLVAIGTGSALFHTFAAPALLVALAIGLYHWRTQRRERFTIPAAVGLSAAAVVFRTLDNAVCASIPIGTHFLWHLLTASALYLFARAAVVVNVPRRPLVV